MVLFWKKFLRECRMDWTDLERMCGHRDGWKQCVRGRMKHLDKWEKQFEHRYVWEKRNESKQTLLWQTWEIIQNTNLHQYNGLTVKHVFHIWALIHIWIFLLIPKITLVLRILWQFLSKRHVNILLNFPYELLAGELFLLLHLI